MRNHFCTLKTLAIVFLLFFISLNSYTLEPTVQWTYEAQSNLYAPPLVAEMHSHPGLETILGDSEARALLCIGADGSLLWEYRGGWKRRLISAASLSRADAQGVRRLAVTNGDHTLHCVDAATGARLWRIEAGPVEWGGPIWADLDGDGTQTLVVGFERGGVAAFDGDGQARWRYRAEDRDDGPALRAPMAAADIDGDGRDELFGCGTWSVFCLNPDGRLRWETVLGDDVIGAPVIADTDRDGQAEFYAASRYDHRLWSIDAATGTVRWCAPLLGPTDVYPGAAIAVGDLAGDGRDEIVLGDAEGRLYAFAHDGALRWVFDTGKPVHLAATLGDVNGNGRIDVLAASGDHYLYALDAEGRLQWKFKTGLRLIGPPTLGDVDLDGFTDVLLCGSDRQLRCLSLGGRYRPDRMPWPTRRFDAAQSGSTLGFSTAQDQTVHVKRALFLHGGFEQDKADEGLTPYPEGSELRAQRETMPRGWVFREGSGEGALVDSGAYSGKRALRMHGATAIETVPIAIEAGLRHLEIRFAAQSESPAEARIEWLNDRGVMPHLPEAVFQAEHAAGVWTVYEASSVLPPRDARWLRLVLAGQVDRECFFDTVEMEGVFEEARVVTPLVNQVGYDTGAPKRFTAQSNWKAEGAAFSIEREDGTEVFRAPLEAAGRIMGHYGNDWGYEYWRGDFSAFEVEGRYRIRVVIDGVEGLSWPFEIGPNLLWQRTARSAYEFFYYQRCGMAIPGFHGACHLDDAIGAESGAQYDLAGGWHDAGDYNKYHNAPYVYGLARAYGIRRADFDALTVNGGLPGFLDEILWGGDHCRRMVAPDGSAFGGITSGYGFWGPPELETDNLPGTGDERPVTKPETGVDPSQHLAALARIATLINDKAAWIETADRALGWCLERNISNAAVCGAAVDLFLATGEERYAEAARATLPEIGANPAVVDVVERFDRAFQTDHREGLRAALIARAGEILELCQNPFGIHTHGPKERPNYFGTPESTGGWHVGTSSFLLEAAAVMALAYRYEPDSRFIAFVYDQLNWTLGNNPYNISLMEGQGSAFAPTYHHRYTFSGVPRGTVPGGVVNGITWRAPGDDRPFFDMSGVDIPAFEPNEVWLPHNTAYLNAIALLQAGKTGE